MKQRNVRMSGTHIEARLNHAVVEVLNLSLTGALLEVEAALPVDGPVMLVLVRDSVEVAVQARVIRSTESASAAWHVAVKFINPSAEARKGIPQLLSKSSRGR